MAEFIWIGTNYGEARGLTAFDFNWPGNWLISTEIVPCIPGSTTLTSTGGPGIVTPIDTVRGNSPIELLTDFVEATQYEIEPGEVPQFTNACKSYVRATRAPGPGDDVYIGGPDYWMVSSPCLFGGYQGGSTGGVWLNGAEDGSGGYTYASGTTYNSSLRSLWFGGIQQGHPDFNYPWNRIGGGFTANFDKYTSYCASPNFPASLWNSLFGANNQTIVYEYRNPNGDLETFTFEGWDGQFTQNGLTYAPEDITDRHLSLRVKADNITESFRSYTGQDIITDIVIDKNLKQYGYIDSTGSLVYADQESTIYSRYSRSCVSFVKGFVRELYNKPAENFNDYGGDPLDDTVHDLYYMLPTEKLVLDGVTAGYLKCYISDQIELNANSTVASLHIDDFFPDPGLNIYTRKEGTTHKIKGVINRDAVVETLGFTGTPHVDNLDNRLYVHAKATNFTRNDGLPAGYANLFIGNNTGIAGITCQLNNIVIDIELDGFPGGSTESWRPLFVYFTGNAPIIVNYMTAKVCNITTQQMYPTSYVSVGSLKLGEHAFFDPFGNYHANWYFGTRLSSSPAVFEGGIEYSQDGFWDDPQTNKTSVFYLSPLMRLFNPSVNTGAPSRLVFNRTAEIASIRTRDPSGS